MSVTFLLLVYTWCLIRIGLRAYIHLVRGHILEPLCGPRPYLVLPEGRLDDHGLHIVVLFRLLRPRLQLASSGLRRPLLAANPSPDRRGVVVGEGDGDV